MGDEALIGEKIGNYVVTELIGGGAMGAVYVAEHPRISRRVAIKVLSEYDPTAAERFLTEARAISLVNHPNVIEIFDYGQTADGRPYFIMELLEGNELGEVIRRAAPMTPEDVKPYLDQICRGLQAAHDQGIVHRDLKPENVFIQRTDPVTVKLLDFGIAKVLSGDPTATSGEVIGTPLTIAPEQAAAEAKKICPQTDLYSLGVILYWMLAGEPPFHSLPTAVLVAMHITEQPPPLGVTAPDVPTTVAELVHACLAKDPANRPLSAAKLAASFAAAVPSANETIPGSVLPAPTGRLGTAGATTTARQPTQVSKPILGVAIGGIVLALALLLFLLAKPDAGPPSPEHPAPAGIAPQAASGDTTPAAPAAVDQGQAPTSAPVVTSPRDYQIKVSVDSPKVSCRFRLDGGRFQTVFAPCKIRALAGQQLELEVIKRGYQPYKERWTVGADRAMALRALSRSRRIVMPGEAPPLARPPAPPGKRPSGKRPPTKQASCVPACANKQCGPDGCGGSCGSCETGMTCRSGSCACTPACANKQCGPDGCGGSCGSCKAGMTCRNGSCGCAPTCAGKQCGPDGCGGSCGSCKAGMTCRGGTCACVAPPRQPAKIRQAILAKRGSIRACIVTFSASSATKGAVRYSMRISPSGKVAKISITDDAIRSSTLNRCVEAALRKIDFGRASCSKSQSVTYPLRIR